MAREMTPQERAAALYRALGDGCDLSAPEQEKRDIEAITDALTDTSRAALLEAAKVCSEWYKIDRTDIHTVAEMAEVLATTLDRLASEGG